MDAKDIPRIYAEKLLPLLSPSEWKVFSFILFIRGQGHSVRTISLGASLAIGTVVAALDTLSRYRVVERCRKSGPIPDEWTVLPISSADIDGLSERHAEFYGNARASRTKALSTPKEAQPPDLILLPPPAEVPPAIIMPPPASSENGKGKTPAKPRKKQASPADLCEEAQERRRLIREAIDAARGHSQSALDKASVIRENENIKILDTNGVTPDDVARWISAQLKDTFWKGKQIPVRAGNVIAWLAANGKVVNDGVPATATDDWQSTSDQDAIVQSL